MVRKSQSKRGKVVRPEGQVVRVGMRKTQEVKGGSASIDQKIRRRGLRRYAKAIIIPCKNRRVTNVSPPNNLT